MADEEKRQAPPEEEVQRSRPKREKAGRFEDQPVTRRAELGDYDSGERNRPPESRSGEGRAPAEAGAMREEGADTGRDKPYEPPLSHAHEGGSMQGEMQDQGRDSGGTREQVGGSRSHFGRDVGSTGASQVGFEGAFKEGDMGRGREQEKRRAAAGRNRGAFDPGSREILFLTEVFKGIIYPVAKEQVLDRIRPQAELQVVEGPRIDVRHAVSRSDRERFEDLGQLITAVEDEFRRAMVAMG